MITQELIKELFDYRDGELYWKVRNSSRTQIGDKAGTLHHTGYLQTRINGKIYKNHRMIFLYHHGYLSEFIDHIDGCRSNNRIENLREASLSQNQHNKKINKNNTSGVKGVCWNKQAKKWLVRLDVDGKQKYFGYYHDIEVAKFIAETMRHKYHKEFANHG